jgi:hypothetical protein
MSSEKGVEVLKAKGHFSSEAQSKRRRKQIADEVAEAKRLEAEGYEVYSPTVVCDRIAVKDGKVFFVDFKKHRKQKLRPGQQRIHDLVPEMYIVQYEGEKI